MPIKLPTIERVAPIAPTRTPLIKAQSTDLGAGQQEQGAAIVRAAQRTQAVYEKAQKDAYSSKIQAMGHELEQFGRRKLNGDPNKPGTGLIHVQGDPDEAYRNFDNELGEKYNKLIADSGFSGENLERAKGTLNRRYNTVYSNSLTHYGNQRSRYKQKLAKTSVEISKRDAFVALGQYNEADESTLEPFKQSLDDIRQARIEEAETVGTARPVPANFKGFKYRKLDPITNETYWLTLDDSVKNQISKDVSKATYESINGMVNGGRIPEARELIKLYGNQIDPVSKAKLDKSFEEAEVEQLAYLQLGKVADLNSKDRIAKLKNMPSKTARQIKVKQESLKLNDANQRFRDNEKKRASKNVYDQVAIQMQELTDPNRAGGNLVDNETAMLNALVEVDGVKRPFKHFKDQITDSSQQKALFKLIQDRPTNGDDEAFGKFMNKIDTDELYVLSFPEFLKESASFSKTQYNTAQSAWLKTRETDGDTRARTNTGRTMMMRTANNMEMLKKSRRTGDLNKASKNLVNELEQWYWQEYVPNMPKGTPPQETERRVREKLIDMKRASESNTGFFGGLFGGSTPTPSPVAAPVPKGSTVDFRRLTPEIKMQLMNQYKKDNNGQTPTLDQIKDLYEKSLSNVSE